MDRFITPQRRWPATVTRLHVYLLPDLDVDVDLANLVNRCRQVLTEAAFVRPVLDEWLHATVQAIGGRSASEIEPIERDELVGRLTTVLADVAPFTLTVGSVLAGASGVVADMDGDLPGQPFHTVHTRVREAIGAVLGPAALASDAMPPHLTAAYANADSDEIQRKLRRVRPSHAAMRIRSVHLVDVAADPDAKTITWTTPIAEILLGQRARSAA